ncbi:protein phosphatase 1L-like isoform X1 [Pecten maximus]|uniref:protein phosphatase 1L-like isoform X1 n=1 Tax=Pecten maximus TaxID=6579 RepID=UPI001458B2AC|nr:protein phosphatase 1L-like isoform X1 [Pecten maximus]
MTVIAACSRFLRRYLFCQEALIFFVLFVIVYNSLFHVKPIWRYFQRAKLKMQLRLNGPNNTYNKIPASLSFPETEEKKASWDLRKPNAAVYAIQGRRPHMEDRFNIVSRLEHTGTSIYGVFDGHGGEFAADFAEKTLFKSIMIRLLKASLDEQTENFTSMLTQEMLNVDNQLLDIARSNMDISGSTALVALVKDGKLTVANIGDSRGVLCDKEGRSIPLSYDHKPHSVKEKRRIKEAGGFVSFNGVWRVAGVLATSRALGDYPLKDKNLLIAEPDILSFDCKEIQPQFIILATDGLWDVFGNQEAVDYIKERLHEPHFGAKSLVLQAYYRGSLDNISVMVVKFDTNSDLLR